jgi:8-oxo-dGTP pyrophosphatase MutT (NUDIX family)
MGKDGSGTGPYRVVESREIYHSEWLRLREDQVLRPDNAPSTFGVVELRPGVAVLALNAHQEAYLVREYKYAIAREALEAVGGALEAGETPVAGGQRELHEELGVEATEWVALGMIDYLSTAVRAPIHLFLALGAEQVGEQQLDPGEMVQRVRLPFAQAVAHVRHGVITHAPSCVLILLAETYLRHRPEYGLSLR